MRNSLPHIHTHIELNKVHNVQCFDELLYQECNVSITPFPGAVTMSPANARNTERVQLFKTPHEKQCWPIISLICLASRVTLICQSWVKVQGLIYCCLCDARKFDKNYEHKIQYTLQRLSTTCTLSITLCNELLLDLSFPCFISLLHYCGTCISPGTLRASVSRSPAASWSRSLWGKSESSMIKYNFKNFWRIYECAIPCKTHCRYARSRSWGNCRRLMKS